MIQNIEPHHFDNTYKNKDFQLTDYCISFNRGKILLYVSENKTVRLPYFQDLKLSSVIIVESITYLFSIDKAPFYLIQTKDNKEINCPYLKYFDLNDLKELQPKWLYFAGVTALHLNQWYESHVYCGKCGNIMIHSKNERSLYCLQCGHIEYPKISPVVMVAVIHQDQILLTRFSADRNFKPWVLVSGFVEIGETFEEAAKREVFEETGLHIKNLRYFSNQPWGLSESIIVGFIAQLDGDEKFFIDQKELLDAKWCSRDQLPQELTEESITYEFIKAFRNRDF